MDIIRNYFAADALRRAEWTGLPPKIGDVVEVHMIDGSASFSGTVAALPAPFKTVEAWIGIRVTGTVGLYAVPADCALVIRRADP